MLTAPTDEWITSGGDADVVSVVVPTHNRAALLNDTLESLTAQTYRPLQLIVVDDGSQDDTAKVVSKAIERAPRGCQIMYERQEPAGGPAARNRGALHSTGEFIVFMDDDDISSKDFLEARVATLRAHARTNLCYGPWKRFMSSGNQYQILDSKCESAQATEPWWYSLLANWDLLLQGCVLRRDLVSRVGPWRIELSKSQDLDYKARLLADETCRPVYSKNGRVFYRLHAESISGRLDRLKLKSHLEVLDRIETMTVQRTDYAAWKERLAQFLWGHAFYLYGSGNFAQGYRELKRAKSHLQSICKRKGMVAGLLDSIGLDYAIGPSYYVVSRCKRALNLSKPRIESLTDRLPT